MDARREDTEAFGGWGIHVDVSQFLVCVCPNGPRTKGVLLGSLNFP